MLEHAVVNSLAQPSNVLPQFLRNLVPLTPVMPFPNCAATTVASLTLLATVPRRLPSSSTSSPPIVHPPGVDTFSWIKAGCSPERTIPAVPLIVCAAISRASALGRPIATAPSIRDWSMRAINAGPEPHRAVETSIIEGGRCTTRPMRLNIQVVRASSSVGIGGSDVAMTVIDSRSIAAVFGMARTIRQALGGSVGGVVLCAWYSTSSICETGTPAHIDISNLPARASLIPSALRMSLTICGLQPSMTTSAASTPFTFSFCRIVTVCGYSLRAFRIRFADSGRLTHATNFVGVRGGGESVIGVAVPESGYAGEGEVEASEIEESMPESIAIPSVPVEIIGQLYFGLCRAIADSGTKRCAP